jgi:hypothetical protein
VEGEADDQHRGEADLASRSGDADREALGEVVKAHRGGDRHPDPQRAGPGMVGRLLLERPGVVGRQLLGAPADRRPWRRAKPRLDLSEPGAAGGEAAAEEQRQPYRVTEAMGPVLVGVDRVLDDREPLRHHVHEQEGENADGEHREGDACSRAEQPHPRERQAEEDRPAREGAEKDRLRKRHRFAV